MPVTNIPNVGEVEYTRAVLPEGIKGKAYIGILEAPILISEDLGTGTKLDYIVAHEIGHRLTLDMIINAYEDAPTFFEGHDAPSAGLIKYFISLGLNRSSISPKHPGTKAHLNEIFDIISRGEYPDEDTSREFVAEVFANWAMNQGDIPPAIATRFKALVKSKNAILRKKALSGTSAVAAYSEPDTKSGNLLLIAALAGAALFIITQS